MLGFVFLAPAFRRYASRVRSASEPIGVMDLTAPVLAPVDETGMPARPARPEVLEAAASSA